MDPKDDASATLRVLLVSEPQDLAYRRLVRVVLGDAGITLQQEVDIADAGRATGDSCVVVVASPHPARAVAGIQALRRALPACPVAVVTSAVRAGDFSDAVVAGATGFLRDDMALASLARALACVASGETVVPRDVVTELSEQLRAFGVPPFEAAQTGLSRRETEVLSLLRAGMTTKGVADRLGIAPVTVRTHIAAIRHKLGAAGRSQLHRPADHGGRPGSPRQRDALRFFNAGPGR